MAIHREDDGTEKARNAERVGGNVPDPDLILAFARGDSIPPNSNPILLRTPTSGGRWARARDVFHEGDLPPSRQI
jgi:hypothetical protein